MKKLLFIIGSLRTNGFNYQLANVFEELLKDRYEISYLKYDDIPFFNQDIEIPTLDVITSIRNYVINTDGIIVFTPEYNNSYPGVLKNLFDWLSRPLVYNDYASGTAVMDKKVVVTGIGGNNKTLGARTKLIKLLKFMKMDVLDYSVGFSVNNDAWTNNKLTLTNEQVSELQALANEVLKIMQNS